MPILNLVFEIDNFIFWNLTCIHLPLPSKNSRFMANHKATKKDVRQATKRRDRNKYYGKTTRNAIRELKELTDKSAAAKELPEVVSMIDKLAKRGIIHKNKASNIKSKLSRKILAKA
jgi:small subunit ribosomal protein S20